jgi:hypothetical protein
MLNFLLVVERVFYILLSVILMLLAGKTFQYFNSLPEAHKAKAVLAWDVIMLFIGAVFFMIKLVVS